MGFEYILTEKRENVLLVTINRPKQLNALNAQLIQEVGRAVESVRNDNTIAGVVITGSGEKAFAAGADIKEFSAFNAKQAEHLSKSGSDVFDAIEAFPKLVIAAVNGFALGGGCELAMACHLRVASPNARFGQPEVNLGLIPGYGGTQRLVQLIGKGKALELLTTADMVGADEAHRLGLVNHLVELSELIDFSSAIIKKAGAKGPVAVAKVIESVQAFFDKEVDGFAAERTAFGECFETEDFEEGTSAFIEKRKPDFKGN